MASGPPCLSGWAVCSGPGRGLHAHVIRHCLSNTLYSLAIHGSPRSMAAILGRGACVSPLEPVITSDTCLKEVLGQLHTVLQRQPHPLF